MPRETRRTIIARNQHELMQLGIGIYETIRLQAIARSLHRLSEASCNYGLTPRQDARADRLERQAADIAHQHDLGCYVQGDPRGWPLYCYRPADLQAAQERYGQPNLTIDALYNAVGVPVCPL